MFFKTNDSVKISYTDTGEEDKEAVICIPGIGASHELWNEAVKLLNNQYRVIVMDPRNQGLSERTYKGLTNFTFRNGLRRIARSFKIR